MTPLDEIEQLIESFQKLIDTSDALIRLRKNKDFQKLILEGYLVNYASDLVLSKAKAEMQNEAAQKYIDGQLAGISHFNQYMNIILTQGVTAKEGLEAHEQERDLILNEELEDV